ncbi:hypothetical protein C8J57DRAFT_1045930, partial [Mycena rebaudengoi]
IPWPLHKDDTLSRSGRSTDLNIYFVLGLESSFCPETKDLGHTSSGSYICLCMTQIFCFWAKGRLQPQNKINIEIRRSTTPGKRVILVQGPC